MKMDVCNDSNREREPHSPQSTMIVDMDFSDDIINVSSNVAETKFDEIVGVIEEILMDEEFQTVICEFCDKYCQQFDENEETNKLEYMTWFQEYTELVESYLQQGLKSKDPSFDMDEFSSMLTEREQEIIGDVWDMLLSMGDFNEFKSMMIAHKQQANGQAIDASQFLQVNFIAE